MRVAISSDHGGFFLKKEIVEFLSQEGHEATDFGCREPISCDYADYAVIACQAVLDGSFDCAVLVCGTGIGMSMAANKIKGIRAALCSDCYTAMYTRKHNDANVLCLGGRVTGDGLALEIVRLFLNTEFEGGRHQTRIDKIAALEQ